MNQHNPRKNTWLVFGVFAVFIRGLSGWEELLAGAPPTEWLPPVTLALLWGLLALFGFVSAVSTPSPKKREGFVASEWGVVAVLIAIPVAGLLFLSMGYDLITVGIDIVGSLIVLVFWLLAGRQKFREQTKQQA